MVKNACLCRACFNDARRALVYFKGYFRILYAVIGHTYIKVPKQQISVTLL